MRRENAHLEFKQALTNTFLKTVSAFANGNGGDIVFGIADDGTILGLDDPASDALTVENKVNSTDDPRPEYSVHINDDHTVTLRVEPGPFTPYTYQGKAYRRGDTSTVPVTRTEYNRLVLKGMNYSFEQLPAHNQELSFSTLTSSLTQHLSLHTVDDDVLKTLELLTSTSGFNNAAALLADDNSFPGLDIARFGNSINQIHNRYDLSGQSLLTQIEKAMDVFRTFYVYENIQGTTRVEEELIPLDAFHEAVANALVHRQWDSSAATTVAMFPDRIEVTSPGGLPEGMTPETYLHGRLAVPRNPILANVFFRLGYIEKFETGIARINYSYRESMAKPGFAIDDESISVTLPVVTAMAELTAEQHDVLATLGSQPISRADVQQATGLTRDATIHALNALIEQGSAIKVGGGPATKYRRASL